MITPKPFHAVMLAAWVLLSGNITQGGEFEKNADRYLQSVRRFADTVLIHGRDTFGDKPSPLFVDGLQIETLQPAVWKGTDGEDWVLSDFANQQALIRLLDGLTTLTGEKSYRDAATQATAYALKNLQADDGLLYWGGHTAWDLLKDRPVGQYQPFVHELKSNQPYYEFMWGINPDATRRLIGAVWGAHIVDWSRLDYNRHGHMQKSAQPLWDHSYIEDVEVPFPATGKNFSFANVTPPLLHAGIVLAVAGHDEKALLWSRRLIYRWQQNRDAKTGLSGGQISYPKDDRAQEALGPFYPAINEAKIIATYHQTSRYHHLPLAQMQAAESLIAAGGDDAKVGQEFIAWASDDLKTYTRECYDEEKGVFLSKMTDGTVIDGEKARKGYYVPASFAPRKPDASLLWGYAMAYRLTRDKTHWHILCQLATRMDLGGLGSESGENRILNFKTKQRDPLLIYPLLELHRATHDDVFLRQACRLADNLLARQSPTGLFPRPDRDYARTGDEVPLALLHLAATLEGKDASLPQPVLDAQYFHAAYHGDLETDKQKRDDQRTYDNKVFYGG